LKAIEKRPKRVIPIDYGPPADPHEGVGEPLVESVWVEPYPDERFGLEDGFASPDARYEQRESVELAFIAALQHLPPRQRAVLILRDVLGFSGDEVADVLDTTTTSVYSALQRAHKVVDERLPERSQQATLRSLGDDEMRELVQNYVEVWEQGDVDALVAMLADDVAISMPPTATWFRGRDIVVDFLASRPLSGALRWRGIPVTANGQIGVGFYVWRDEEQAFMPHGVNVITVEGEKITDIVAFIDAKTIEVFGLPERLSE
jgi:RNA polymerase sigma-70 factor (ECF subfamily)